MTDSTKASVSDSVWTVVVSEESGTRVVSVTPDSVVDSSPSFFSPNFRDLKVIKKIKIVIDPELVLEMFK